MTGYLSFLAVLMELMVTLETWARTNGEALTYVVFFGLLVAMGLIEAFAPRSHESAKRFSRWSVNALLTTSWIMAGALVPLSLLAAADIAVERDWGLLNWFDAPPIAAFALGALSRSLCSYWMHVLMHKTPVFWRIHRVHHSDVFLDLSTTARFHPLEAFATAPFMLAGVLFFGVPPAAVILYEAFDAAAVVFAHANIRLPRAIDVMLRVVFVTPDMHRLHHSSFQPETDSNYGATLSIWDRLFGTYRSKSYDAIASMSLGLAEISDARSRDPIWLLISPFIRLRSVRVRPEAARPTTSASRDAR